VSHLTSIVEGTDYTACIISSLELESILPSCCNFLPSPFYTILIQSLESQSKGAFDLAKPVSDYIRNQFWFQRNNQMHFPASTTTRYQAYYAATYTTLICSFYLQLHHSLVTISSELYYTVYKNLDMYIFVYLRLLCRRQTAAADITRKPSCCWQTRATRKHTEIAPILSAYNVVADNTGLSSFSAVVASEMCEIPRNSLKIQTYRVENHLRSSIFVSIGSAYAISYSY